MIIKIAEYTVQNKAISDVTTDYLWEKLVSRR
ncbi:MAG: hypothetical protein Greene071436_153 [Parcubacteria group bacterium Greene0714_36]|nr:MAG: hypothetical protein Greene071436_153 [Parcubacteria group bacterium Greene0714_36]